MNDKEEFLIRAAFQEAKLQIRHLRSRLTKIEHLSTDGTMAVIDRALKALDNAGKGV